MTRELVLPFALQLQIIDQSLAGKPEEICGIVRGRDRQATALVPSRNAAEERTINYLVEPSVLMQQFVFEDEGDSMVAIYHSHPESPAYPSATDAWTATYPESVYLICSLDALQPVIRGFELLDIEADFDLTALRQQTSFYETRPGLFAWYRATGTPLPDALDRTRFPAWDPFYVVWFQPDPADEPEVRVVRIGEIRIKSH